MDNKILDDMRSELNKLKQERVQLKFSGVVTATSPLSVTVGGAAEPYTDVVPCVHVTGLAIGQKVLLAKQGNSLVVIGRLT